MQNINIVTDSLYRESYKEKKSNLVHYTINDLFVIVRIKFDDQESSTFTETCSLYIHVKPLICNE